MKQKPLFTVDGETLTTTLLPPVRFVVEDFLPQGLHLLAGASKIGKSWLALWLCLHQASHPSPSLSDNLQETLR